MKKVSDFKQLWNEIKTKQSLFKKEYAPDKTYAEKTVQKGFNKQDPSFCIF